MRELIDKSGKIVYSEVVKQYPWIVERGKHAILSPDSDGFLCGLLMQHLLGWDIVGYYDAKVMLLRDGMNASDCVFLDMEIFRDFARSIGQHMLMNNVRKDLDKPNWANFVNCISPNNMRMFDRTHTFRKKYPLGTIHFLLGIVGSRYHVEIKKEAICPLMYTDGTFKNIFGYPDNALDWLSFLCAEDHNNPLFEVFFNSAYTTSDLMIALNELFATINKIGGDGLTVSNGHGEPVNLNIGAGNLYDINQEQKDIARGFLGYLSSATGWNVDESKWTFEHFKVSKFVKGQISNPPPHSGGPSLADQFDEMLAKSPISWAVTKVSQVQYTLEQDKLR